MSTIDKVRRLMPEPLVPVARKVVNAVVFMRYGGDKGAAKAAHEMAFWKKKAKAEGRLNNDWYRGIYTDAFGLDEAYFFGKRMLDIGCGPRGSLEWNSQALERVGLDPLVPDYRQLGIDSHAMRYVAAGAEEIPFPTGHFDIVAAINSLDHVDDLDAVIAEVARVTRVGGDFLLIVEVGHAPTITEPIGLWWNDMRRFDASFEVLVEQQFEKRQHGVFESLSEALPFDHSKPGRREGILISRMRRR